MAVIINGTTGVGVSTTPSYPVDVAVGTLGTTAASQLVGAKFAGIAGVNGDSLEISEVRGSAGTDWTTSGWRLQQRVDGTWMGYIQFNGTSSGTNNSGISIGTGSSTVNANSVLERLRIDSVGNVTLSTNTGKLGYGTGSGSAVTQITSRTTAVAINTPTGQITMFTAIGSTTWQRFQVTNTIVAATDTVIVNTGTTTNDYIVTAAKVVAGSFYVYFVSTGGVASDTPVINFAVIKASAA